MQRCFYFTLLQGLVVPVIRNVEEMNYADIEKAINSMGEKVHICVILRSTYLSRPFLLER